MLVSKLLLTLGEPPSARELVDKYSGVGIQFKVKVRVSRNILHEFREKNFLMLVCGF